MARTIKSLSHGHLPTANPYESPPPRAKSTRHREHRSKKGRRYIHQYATLLQYKLKKAALVEKELISEIRQWK